MEQYHHTHTEAEFHFSIGNAHRKQGQYTEALDAYKKTVAIKPGFAAAYYVMGNVYYKLKQYADALDAFEKVINLKPDFAHRAYYVMGDVYKTLEQHSDALLAYEKSIASEPTVFWTKLVRQHIKRSTSPATDPAAGAGR
jgi:tetratricopeptide (TPR) repeat protein